MAILEILQYPDMRLHEPAQRVEKIDAETRKLVDDMAETMYAAPGIGLAATQLDIHKQIIVIDVSLYQHGIPIHSQDLTFTALFAVLAAAIAGGPHLAARMLGHETTPMGLKVAVAAAILIPQAIWTAARVRRWMRRP